jgi:molybdopterin synthase sulfur carrier subunit
MLNIHYFASVREALQKDQQQLAMPGSVSTVADLIQHLSANDPAFESLHQSANGLLVAVNQTVVDTSYKLSEDDEVAFFPPMTGG